MHILFPDLSSNDLLEHIGPYEGPAFIIVILCGEVAVPSETPSLGFAWRR
jgi:hypothetical protein